MSTFPKTTISYSDAETERLGEQLAAHLAGGSTVALHGELGAGKTVLSRGIARGLGIHEPVTSPTFTIVQEYRGTHFRLFHIDLYRIAVDAEALAFGIEEYLGVADAVTVVEWPDRIEPLLDAAAVRIDMKLQGPTQRLIRCRCVPAQYTSRFPKK